MNPDVILFMFPQRGSWGQSLLGEGWPGCSPLPQTSLLFHSPPACVSSLGYGRGLYCKFQSLRPSKEGLSMVQLKGRRPVQRCLALESQGRSHYLLGVTLAWLETPRAWVPSAKQSQVGDDLV